MTEVAVIIEVGERGAAKPSMDLLFLIAQELNVDITKLLKEESEL